MKYLLFVVKYGNHLEKQISFSDKKRAIQFASKFNVCAVLDISKSYNNSNSYPIIFWKNTWHYMNLWYFNIMKSIIKQIKLFNPISIRGVAMSNAAFACLMGVSVYNCVPSTICHKNDANNLLSVTLSK